MDTITELARQNETAFMDAAIEQWTEEGAVPAWAEPFLRKADDLHRAELALASWAPQEGDGC